MYRTEKASSDSKDSKSKKSVSSRYASVLILLTIQGTYSTRFFGRSVIQAGEFCAMQAVSNGVRNVCLVFYDFFFFNFKGLENVEILDRFGGRMWKIGEGWFVMNYLKSFREQV